MKHLLCAAALAALTSSFASAATHTYEYTMKITSIRVFSLWGNDPTQTPQSVTLPIGSVTVGDVGRGSFGVAFGSVIGYGHTGSWLTQVYQNRGTPQQFTVGTISHVASYPNSITLSDSYDARHYADYIAFRSMRDSEWLAVEFIDPTASHLAGTEPRDIGNFPLENFGTFEFQMSGTDGLYYKLGGTLLTLSADGGPAVELPAPTPLPIPSPVPEPGPLTLLLAGLGVLASGRLLRGRARAA